MKGFIIKNTKTGQVYTGKAKWVDNPNYDSKINWIDTTSGFFGQNNYYNFNQKPESNEKVISEKLKAQYPLFYKKDPWTGELREYSAPLGSDGTNGPPWKEKIPNYWGDEPRIFATKRATRSILSVITKSYYKDRENETTALLYLPENVHNYKVVQVEITIKEVEDGTGIATTTSESK